MIVRPLGSRKRNQRYLYDTSNNEYDYERYGLLNKLLPGIVYNSKNMLTRSIIDSIEITFIFLYRYIDKLKYFKSSRYNDYL